MRQKTKNIIAGILIIGIVIGILIGIGINYNKPLALTSAPSYLSIDKIDNVGVGSEFLIYATGGSAEEMKIEFTAQEINDEIESEGYMVDRGISAIVRINKWEHSYPITLTENTFRTIGVQDLVPYIGSESSCDLSDCSNSAVPNQGNYILAYAYDMSSILARYYCKCVYWNPTSKVGQFYSDASSVDFNINFTIGSETKSMNKNNLVVSLVNGNFRAEYVGNLATLFPKSKPTYAVLYDNGAYQNLISSTGFNYNGINIPQTYFNTCTQNKDMNSCGFQTCNEFSSLISSCINNYNSDLGVGISDKDSEYLSNSNTESLSFSGNNFVTQDAIPSFQPTFKLFINAEWVGLKELVGDPKITSCAEDMNIPGGTAKQTSMNVQNIGASAGQFDYSATCGSTQVSFTGAGGLVEAGQTQAFYLSFSGTNTNPNAPLTGTCTHKITDRKSQKSVTCISSYSVSYSGDVCQAGQFRCNPSNNKLLERCNNLGIAWESYKTCTEVCEFKNGNFQCSEGGNGGGNEKCSSCWAWLKDKVGIQQDCDRNILQKIWDGLKCPFHFLKLGLILIAGLFALLFGQAFSDKTFRNIPYWATWVIAILFSGLIGVLAYMFLEWYYVIPVLLVLFVFGIIVNAIPGKSYIMGAIKR